MSAKLKYDLSLLEWQQFESLAFKCLQFDISPSIQFIDGGNDKGRDILYNGITYFFTNDNVHRSYVFQVKHKSKQDGFSDLKRDLEVELNKVYIENKFDYEIYCLVTNLTLSGNQVDELEEKFNLFISENSINNVNFRTYNYRHFEGCIDNNSSVKWSFPIIVPASDTKFLLDSLLNKAPKTISEGWLSVFERNKKRFIHTDVFDLGLEKLADNKILLFSGPPKSGKTFNAEMILLNKFSNGQFIPYKINTPEDFEKLYNRDEKQIFLFDDAFGKHDIEIYRADIFNRKLEFIFELIDDDHLCVFTSREYIFKAFSNYADESVQGFINKINVEVSQLSLNERESLFIRYFKIAFSEVDLPYYYIDGIITHKNFSPETIRSYFDNATSFDITDFKSHLDLPDKYLEKVFNNLSEEKRIILLSVLLSLKSDEPTIGYSFSNICYDLNKQLLIVLKNELTLMDGSIIKAKLATYDFYHPSMNDFFISFLSNDISTYRSILFKNLNIEFLTISKFQPSQYKKQLEIRQTDITHLKAGFERLIKNPSISLFELNSLFSWLNDIDVQLNLKLKLKLAYGEIIDRMYDSLAGLDYRMFTKEGIAQLSDFFRNVGLFIAVSKKPSFFSTDYLIDLIKHKKDEDDFWLLVFRIAPIVEDEFIKTHIGRDWLNAFYLRLKNDIAQLGKELYGDGYPDFPEVDRYKKLIEEKNHIEAGKIKKKARADYEQRTGNNWFPRYKLCKEKMNVLKSSPMFGYKIHQRLIYSFGNLMVLEDRQKNRYYFNKKKKWWT